MRNARMFVVVVALAAFGSLGLAPDCGLAEEPPPEPEPVYYPFDFGSLTFASDWAEEDWEEDWGDYSASVDSFQSQGDGIRGTCSGYCEYTDSDTEITCTHPGIYENVVVGVDYHSTGDSKIIMCHQQAYFWVKIGECDRESIDKLVVNGSAYDDSIAIVRYEACEDLDCDDDCDFKDFTDVFESGHLKMYGQGDCDKIYGSQHDDTRLEAEYVEGKQGTDIIYLTNDDTGCVSGVPTAHGQLHTDEIYGTEIADEVWADIYDYSTYPGDDYVDGSSGDDDIVGGYGSDELYGNNGDDDIWGSQGNDDELYGGNNDDALSGGPGTGDYCNGGGEDVTDTCYADCETRVDCDP